MSHQSLLRSSRIVHAFLTSVVLLLAGCSLSRELTKMDEPEDFEAFAAKWAPSEDAFVAVQRAAKPFIDAKNWSGAFAVFERFAPRFPAMKQRFETIAGILKAPPDSLVMVRSLGAAINSPGNDIKPSLTADGTRLYFASDREGGRGELDIYVSKYANRAWQPAQNLGEKINTKDHETLNSISFDGTEIFLYGGFPGHLGNGDNYYFEKTDRGWSPIQHIPFPVNSNAWDSDAFLTADGKALLFVTDRLGGIGKTVAKGKKFHGGEGGNSDIWVSIRRGKQWLPPMNLGEKINTPYCERSPFLHPDGKTLYFCSDGHAGIGKLDVFKTVRLREDSWTEWSEPVNLGKDINTSEDDWGYKVSVDGKSAYFSSADLPGGMGLNDIYEVSLPVAAQPEGSPVAMITGSMLDDNGNPIKGRVKVSNLANGMEEGEVRSDPQTGEFVLTLPAGRNYGVYFEADSGGYYPYSANLDLRDDALNKRRALIAQGIDPNDPNGRNRNGGDPNDPNNRNRNGGDPNDPNNRNGGDPNDPNNRNRNGGDPNDPNNRNGGDSALLFKIPVQMASLEGMKNKRDQWGDLLAQRVNNVFFDFGKWELKPESSQELDRLARFLAQNPEIRIQLGAHTDDVGSDAFNMELSLKRAQSVVDYLISHGTAQARLVAKGYGKTRPEVPNDTEENRARNRRVEFRIAE
jgi:outer membrane protein OmpA-like peptidoglycan-associated protein